jgi:hypothetical protein
MCLTGFAFTVPMPIFADLIEQSAQLHQGLSFELTDALTGDSQLFADLGKRVTFPIADPEAQCDHSLFPRSQKEKCVLQLSTK